MSLEIVQIPVLDDNYVYLLHESESQLTAIVDPAVYEPVQEELTARNWNLNLILNTHHHPDHVGANLKFQDQYNCEIYGYGPDAARLPGISKHLSHDDQLFFGKHTYRVMFTPGHTLGHICYFFSEDNLLFCGDTLFSFGCGRLFEGSQQQMLSSLSQIRKLPDNTQFFCAHEYTLNNIEFALSIEPDNELLRGHYQLIQSARAQGQPTIPGHLGLEKELSPFLRWDDKELKTALGTPQATDLETFTRVREKRNSW